MAYYNNNYYILHSTSTTYIKNDIAVLVSLYTHARTHARTHAHTHSLIDDAAGDKKKAIQDFRKTPTHR